MQEPSTPQSTSAASIRFRIWGLWNRVKKFKICSDKNWKTFPCNFQKYFAFWGSPDDPCDPYDPHLKILESRRSVLIPMATSELSWSQSNINSYLSRNWHFDLPLALPTSPSGWANPWKAEGDMQTGNEIGWPRIVVPVSLLETSRRTLGMIWYLHQFIRTCNGCNSV